MAFNPETRRHACGGCGEEFDVLPAEGTDEHLLYRPPAEFIHLGPDNAIGPRACTQSNHPDGNWHEPFDVEAVERHLADTRDHRAHVLAVDAAQAPELRDPDLADEHERAAAEAGGDAQGRPSWAARQEAQGAGAS